jgi:hypothetical protein
MQATIGIGRLHDGSIHHRMAGLGHGAVKRRHGELEL